MKLEGAQVIAADRMAVWNAINDPEVLKRCIAGCEEMTRTSPTQYDAVVKQKIGPVSATFKGEVHLSEIDEGNSLRLHGEGKGGVAGMAKGGALVTLSDVDGGTQLAYDAEASVAGKLAQLGSRLIDGVAQKMINSFFANFKEEVEAGAGGAATGTMATGDDGSTMAGVVGAAGVAGTAAMVDIGADDGMVDVEAVDAHTFVDGERAGQLQGEAMARAGVMQDAMGGAAASASSAAASAGTSAAMAASAGAAGVADVAAAARVSDAARDGHAADARTGALHDAEAERMLNPAIGAGAGDIDMDDPEIGDIDVSSVDGGPSEDEARTAGFDAARAAGSQADGQPGVDVSGNLAAMADGAEATARGAAADAHAAAARVGESVDAAAVDAQTQADAVADDAANASRSGMDAGAAGAAGVGAAVGAIAAGARGRFDEAHESVRERVIAAGGDVDEAKSWSDTKEHLNRAASETRDTAQDVYDAARARIEGDKERAAAEWNDARTNAGDTVRELRGAGEDAATTARGYAAEEAKAPRVGPLGQPWYLWIIGVLVLLVILWIL